MSICVRIYLNYYSSTLNETPADNTVSRCFLHYAFPLVIGQDCCISDTKRHFVIPGTFTCLKSYILKFLRNRGGSIYEKKYSSMGFFTLYFLCRSIFYRYYIRNFIKHKPEVFSYPPINDCINTNNQLFLFKSDRHERDKEFAFIS